MRQHGTAPLSLSVRIPRPSLSNAFRTVLLVAALPLNTSIAFAQGAGGAKSPATAIEIERMVSVASINMCILSKSKVPFLTAMQANMVPMVSYIKEVNGSKISGVKNGQALTSEEVANGLAMQLLPVVGVRCGKDLPQDYKKEVTKAEKLLKSQPGS
ncbi:hypothetical protein MITS9509_02499 [Synechococcus sp. MIT S9509]|nr:hypothetical protein MITS9504_02401 [Synechococcus sp. MIT S9504]KZR91271.1 hypothetical protein MITS9509_02499 [Synechococcus sp. MIT S9509]